MSKELVCARCGRWGLSDELDTADLCPDCQRIVDEEEGECTDHNDDCRSFGCRMERRSLNVNSIRRDG